MVRTEKIKYFVEAVEYDMALYMSGIKMRNDNTFIQECIYVFPYTKKNVAAKLNGMFYSTFYVTVFYLDYNK